MAEKRPGLHGVCPLDGKVSAVHHQGRFWLFLRANLARTGGARHVMVTSSADLQTWSELQWLDIPVSYTHLRAHETLMNR
eukprot:3083677-Prymnesium_polylepis.1